MLLLLAVVLTGIPVIARASTTGDPEFYQPYPELDRYLRMAIEQNPELRAIWHEYRSDLEEIPQVGTLPDPEVRLGYDFNPMDAGTILGRFSVSAMQMFPWFGTLSSRRSMQQASADVRLRQLNSRQLTLFRDIKTVWMDLSEIDHQITIAGETLELVRNLEALVEARYETARAGQADLLRIQMEEERIKTKIANLEDHKKPLTARFNELLNRESDAEVQLSDDIWPRVLPAEVPALQTRIQKNHPAFGELDARDRMLREQERQAKLSGRPDFGLGLEVMGRDFGPISMNPDMNEGVVGMATVRVPLYRSRYQARRREAVEQQRSLMQRRDQTENRLMTELEEILEFWRETDRSLKLLDEELLPRALQALEVLHDEYAAGNVRFDEVLQMQRELLNLQLEQLTVLVRQNKALIRLESLIEAPLAYE